MRQLRDTTTKSQMSRLSLVPGRKKFPILVGFFAPSFYYSAMSLSSLQLDAFVAAARTLSFSRAAELLFITQSALSQRIKNLEQIIGAALFLREPSGIRITEIGERLLRYCQIKNALEDELLFNLTSTEEGELAGIIRIGVFSSILRSVVIPAVSPLLRKNRKIQCDFLHQETHALLPFLERGEVDYIILDYLLNLPSIEQVILGYEEYVVIESSEYPSPPDVYLDNAPEDSATENFFSFQGGEVPKYRRLFMGETYGILSGVEQGLGRAVMPVHLVKGWKGLKIAGGFKKYNRAIVLHYHKQSHYPQIHHAMVNQLAADCQKYLSFGIE
ncbi:MAG: LysR family transcriptional regulator [Spirochaetales bacterium]|nr:LysR family transcriptional regulator [Spirochaetales bacterium]